MLVSCDGCLKQAEAAEAIHWTTWVPPGLRKDTGKPFGIYRSCSVMCKAAVDAATAAFAIEEKSA